MWLFIIIYDSYILKLYDNSDHSHLSWNRGQRDGALGIFPVNIDKIPHCVTAGRWESVSWTVFFLGFNVQDVPMVCRQGTEKEEIIAFSYSPFILLRGDDIILPLSEVIGITQYTNSIPNSCQYFKFFSCQIFYASAKPMLLRFISTPLPLCSSYTDFASNYDAKAKQGKGTKQEF